MKTLSEIEEPASVTAPKERPPTAAAFRKARRPGVGLPVSRCAAPALFVPSLIAAFSIVSVNESAPRLRCEASRFPGEQTVESYEVREIGRARWRHSRPIR